MSESVVPSIEQFHARLFSPGENGKLMTALRQLAKVENAPQLTASAAALDGWYVWFEQPADDRGFQAA